MWGLDAMALTFVAPHDLRARPFVVPRGHDLEVWNRTADVGCAVLVDGHRLADAGPGARVSIRLGEQRSLLGTLPDATFVRRYRQSFGSSRLEPRRRSDSVCDAAPPVYDLNDAPPPPDREPRPHPRGRARARRRAERAERRDRCREDDLRPGDRAAARRQGGRRRGRPRRRARRTSRPSSTCRTGSSTTAELAALAELRPEDEPGLVLARRVFADGRTRAYAWGRAVAREDLAAATERLIAMSGQFEQRRLARPAYQLDVLDAFIGEPSRRRGGSRRATPGGRSPLHAGTRDEIARDAGAAAARVEALRELVERTRRASSAGRRTRCGPSGSGCATLPSCRGRRCGHGRRSRPRTVTARRRSPPRPSGRSTPLHAARARARGTGERASRAGRAAERGGERPAPVRRLARGRPGPGRGGRRSGSTCIAELRRRFAAQTPRRAARARESRCGRARRAGRRARSRRGRRAPSWPGPRPSTTAAADALREARRQPAEPFAAAVAENLRGRRHG